jgi:hypothetical protein
MTADGAAAANGPPILDSGHTTIEMEGAAQIGYVKSLLASSHSNVRIYRIDFIHTTRFY